MKFYSSLVSLFGRPSVSKSRRRRQQTRRTTGRRLLMEGLEDRLALAGDLFCGPYPASSAGIAPQLVEVEVGASCTGSIKFDTTNDMNDIANFIPDLADDSERELIEGKWDFATNSPEGNYVIDLGGGQEITITVTEVKGDAGELEAIEFSWVSDVGIDLVFVKAGDAGLLYDYTAVSEPTSDSDLVTVERLQGKLEIPTWVGISHISFGYDEDEVIDIDETLVIEGFKYNDHNGNGAQDAGDDGIAGWHFTIWVDSNDNGVQDTAPEAFVDLDSDGLYDVGESFTDTIANGIYDPTGEVHDVVTGTNGLFSYSEEVSSSILAGDVDYDVQEVLPLDLSWVPTQGEDGYTGTFTPTNTTVAELIFGNTNVGSENGKTIGFWSNKNGQALITQADIDALNALHLRNAAGVDQNWTGSLAQQKSALKSFLLGASATNMANMLSAQLAATVLNARHGNFGTSTEIHIEGVLTSWSGNSQGSNLTNNLDNDGDSDSDADGLVNQYGFANITALIAAAEAELTLHGTAGSADSWRDYQEALKIAFDGMNNNLAIFAQ
jgi:hypothetical protein